MEGLSWSASPHREAFKRQSSASDTLNRLASFIARAESKQGIGKSYKPPPHPFTLPKPHRCSSCGMAFSLRSSLQLHVCEASFQPILAQTHRGPTHATSLIPNVSRDGQPVVVDRSPYACAPCGRGFMLKQALLHHQQAGCDTAASHLDNPESPSADSPPASEEDDDAESSSSLYVPDVESNCKFCARTFSDEAACRRHSIESHSDEQGRTRASSRAKTATFCCRTCDMAFNSTDELSKHRKEEHSRSMKPNVKTAMRRDTAVVALSPRRERKPTNNTYTCQICSQVFFHHLSLWAHKRKHPSAKLDHANQNTPSTKDCTSVEKPNLGKNCVPRKPFVQEHSESVPKILPSKFHKQPPFPVSFKLQKRAEVPKDDQEEDEDQEDEETEFPCPSCPQVFSQCSELKAHAELHQSAVRRSRCSVCHGDMTSLKWPGAKRLRLYHCLLCGTGFSTLQPFLSHCQNHLQLSVDDEDGAEGT